MNGIHFRERLQIECLKIGVCTIVENCTVRDLCFVAFARFETDLTLQINVASTEKSQINVCVQGADRYVQFRMIGYDLVRRLSLLDQRSNDLVDLTQLMFSHIYATACIAKVLLILPVCKTGVVFILVSNRTTADLFITAIADIRSFIEAVTAFLLKVTTCLVTGGAGSAFHSAQDDLSTCISLFTVITMDTKVLCIVERAFMIPVRQAVLLHFLGNGCGIFA